MSVPVLPVVYPERLNRYGNGNLPAKELVNVAPADMPKRYLNPEAASLWLPFATAARRSGFDLVVSEGYRSYAGQAAAFDGSDPVLWRSPNRGRYVPEDLWDEYEEGGGKWASGPDIRKWLGKRWKRRSGTVSSAVPGDSNHGMAAAVDAALANRANPSYPYTRLTQEALEWMVGQAVHYGWSWEWRTTAGKPWGAEPWHLHTIRLGAPNPGDPKPDPTDPEVPGNPGPTPTRKPTMLPLDFGNPPGHPDGADSWWTRLTWTGDTLTHVRSPADRIQARAGLAATPVTEAELSALLDTVKTIGPSPFVAGGQAPNKTLDGKWVTATKR